MISFLWTRRERPVLFSKRWFVVWAKRILNAYGLLLIVKRRLPAQISGVQIGALSIVYGLELNGSGRKVRIGDFTFVGKDVHISTHDHVDIGSYVCINNNVTILTASHQVDQSDWSIRSRPVVIEDYAWVAWGATLMPGVRIGHGAVVGAGAVVTRDVPAFAVATGNPARITLNRRNAELDYNPVEFAAPYEAWTGCASRNREKR